MHINFEQLYLIILMGIFLVIPLGCITIAPRFIPAYEVEIFFILETILGPMWVWLFINEQPTVKTIIGGLFIIFVIMSYTYSELRKKQK
tara:strand:- start:299 stop:565 length:267 start_codon:yes stop_codon:yes gene_type:complete